MATKSYCTLNQKGVIKKLNGLTAPWEDISIPLSNTFYSDIMAVPGFPDRIITCGLSQREIAISNDAGISWVFPVGNYTALDSNAGFSEVWIVDEFTSYIVGHRGVVLKSVDGGVTYNTTLTFPTQTSGLEVGTTATCVHFINANIGVVGVYETGIGTSVWKTIDGGDTWTRLNGDAIVSVSTQVSLGVDSYGGGIFISDDEADIKFLVRDSIFRSTDSGATFTEVYDFSAFAIGAGVHLTRFDSLNLWATGSNGSVVRTTDGGTTWIIVQFDNESGQILSGHFYTTLDGFIGTGDVVNVALKGINVTDDGADTISPSEVFGIDVRSIWTEVVECPDLSVTGPINFGTIIVGETGSESVTITNNGDIDEELTFSLSGCSPDISIITPSPSILGGGHDLVVELEYSPTQNEIGECVLNITNSCGLVIPVNICFASATIPSCPHFKIDITGPSCAPDCIAPGSVVQFDLGGNISPEVYPTTVHFSVYNSATTEVIFEAEYPVQDDAELDAIIVNFVAPAPGHYCSEVCLPGCNTKRILCFDVCEPFDIYKDECFKWHVHRPSGSTHTEFLVNVFVLEGDSIITEQLWDTDQNNTFEFEVPTDGIYIFEMRDPDTKDLIYSFSAFETCSLQECYMILMDKIMCSCFDPCCKKCTDEVKQQMEFARMTLNRLVPLYMMYLGMARRNELYTVGMKLISNEQNCFLHDANQVLDKILEIIEDCGCLCPEQKNTASNRGGCTTC